MYTRIILEGWDVEKAVSTPCGSELCLLSPEQRSCLRELNDNSIILLEKQIKEIQHRLNPLKKLRTSLKKAELLSANPNLSLQLKRYLRSQKKTALV